MLYVRMQTKNSPPCLLTRILSGLRLSIRKCRSVQVKVINAVRSYNEVVEIAGRSTVRMVCALPKFTIPDDKLLMVELYEKNGGRHQSV